LIVGVIMAAGFSKRMGKDKLLLPFKGKPIVEHVIKGAVNSKVDQVLLIYRTEQVQQIGAKYKIDTLFNDKAELGQSASVRLAVRNSPKSVSAFLFFVGDQPFVSTELINKVIEVYCERKPKIIVPVYGNRNRKRGTPVLFSSDLKNELLNIKGDKGGRDLIDIYSQKNSQDVVYIKFEDEMKAFDIDTWDDYKQLIKDD